MASPSIARSGAKPEKRNKNQKDSKRSLKGNPSVSFGAPGLLEASSSEDENYASPAEWPLLHEGEKILGGCQGEKKLPTCRSDARVLIYSEWEEGGKKTQLDMSDSAIFRRFPHLRPESDDDDAQLIERDGKVRLVLTVDEPAIGTILEQDDGPFYHYSIYVGDGRVLGVNSPGAAVCVATIDTEQLHLWWRPVWVPQEPIDKKDLMATVGMTIPYVATTTNCYQACCWILGIKDTWLRRMKVQRASNTFYSPEQPWNHNVPEPTAPSRLRYVADSILTAVATLVGRPLKNLLGTVKPLNVFNIIMSCDWSFAGIVNAIILLCELFDIFWTPPDISNWLSGLVGAWQMEGPLDLALDIVPTLLGGLGLALGMSSESCSRKLSATNAALRAAQDLGKFAIEVFKQIMSWIYPTEDQTLSTLAKLEARVIANEVSLENKMTALLRDTVRGKEFVAELDEEERDLRNMSAKLQKDSATSASIGSLLARIATLRASFEKAKSELTTRRRPVVVFISGRPGIGKTMFVSTLAKDIARALGDPGSVGIIPRADVDHWDTYKGQRVMTWDDFGADNPIKDAQRLQLLADTCPVTLNCDRIENKGKFFDSDVILITSNMATPVPLDYVNMEAVVRRIDFLVYAESPAVEDARTHAPGDVGAWKQVMQKDFSHLVLTLAPQSGFDRQGNTPYGKGVTKRTTPKALTAKAVALVCERIEDFQLEGPVYNFDESKIEAFKRLATDNGIGLWKMAKVGYKAMGCKTVEEVVELMKDFDVKPCEVIYGGATYRIACANKEPEVIKTQEAPPVATVAGCVRRVREARLRAYIRMAQDVVQTILQVAGAGFSIYHQIEKASRPTWFWDESYGVRDGPGAFDIFDDDDDGWYIDEGKKGKTKKGRGAVKKARVGGIFRTRGLTDEEYDEYKRRREEHGGRYTVDDFIREYDQEQDQQAEDDLDDAMGDRHTAKMGRRARRAARAELGLVTGSDIRKRKAIDWNVVGPSWADDDRKVDYNEKLSFEAPVSVWSRIVNFGTGWGFWVSPHVFITAKHVAPDAKEIFGVQPDAYIATSCGDFMKYKFHQPMRPDLTPMVLENGAPEGTVGSILIKRASGELVSLGVRMGTHASVKVGDKNVHGQTGMLLTGANAKAQDLGTLPGDCGSPYVYKKGNHWVVFGVHSVATRSGNTVICAVNGEPDLEVFELQGPTLPERPKGTYAGLPICDYGDAPPLSSKTMFWRTEPNNLPAGSWEPAYLGSNDARVKGPSLQQVLRDQLKHYAEPRGRLPPREILEAVVETIENRLEMTLDPPKPWSFQQACNSLDKNTSSGYPHHLQKAKRWSGTSFTGELGDQASHANAMYEMGKSMMPVYTAALKDELVKPEKIYNTIKKRLLWGSDLGTMVRAARAFGPFCDSLKETCVFNPVRVGMSMNEDGPFVFARHARYKYHSDADFSRWDSTQNREILRLAMDMMVKMSPEPQLARVVANDLMAPSVLDVGDYKVVVEEGLPSGFPCTAQVNSLAHWILTLSALVEATRLDPDVIMANSEFSFYGDDEIVSTNLEVDATRYTQVLKEYGLLPTRADKTDGPITFSENLPGHIFLRRTICGDQFGWYGKLDRNSIQRQLDWTRGPNHKNPYEVIATHSNRAPQLMALLGEAAMHGPKYYQKIASRVAHEAAVGGLEINIPRHAATLRWVRFGTVTAETPQDRTAIFVNEDE
uniref:Polyprotein n=1 Tax=Norovirus Rn/GV/HKU_KT/HKG/2012 TaxID=1246679 RepID=K4NU77_NORV|nr:polyprotein [Norovirus Rn/GV/HKU_KT/HKG/2012]